MALFFSGAVTSSPVKRRLRSSHCQSLDVSLLSPDSSYICYTSVHGSEPCCCRRSPRLLTNGYYDVTENSFSWDDEGNVSLTPCKTSISYKENLHRVFRRRRRPRSSLVRLLSDVTESCQSWLDEKVFRGVSGQGTTGTRSRKLTRTMTWTGPGAALMVWPVWTSPGRRSTAPSWRRAVPSRHDPTEVPTPPDKEAPPPNLLIHEEICSEICQSKERFTQSLGGLSEVPPPSPFYTNTCCCQVSPEPTGFTMKALLLLFFTVFIFTALYSGCLWWSATVTSTVFMMITTCMLLTKSGPLGEWRRAKTEDITSRNE